MENRFIILIFEKSVIVISIIRKRKGNEGIKIFLKIEPKVFTSGKFIPNDPAKIMIHKKSKTFLILIGDNLFIIKRAIPVFI